MQSIKTIVKPLTSVGKVSVLDISWVLATYLDNFDCKMYPETWCSTAKFHQKPKTRRCYTQEKSCQGVGTHHCRSCENGKEKIYEKPLTKVVGVNAERQGI